MKIKNTSTTQAVNIHDSLANNFEEHYQPGIKDVTLAPLEEKTIADTNASESTALQSFLVSGEVTITGKDQKTGTVGLDGGNIVHTELVTFVGTTFRIAFGVDGTADTDQIAVGHTFATIDEYGVLLTLQSGVGVTVTAKTVNDFTITGTAADKVAVQVFRTV